MRFVNFLNKKVPTTFVFVKLLQDLLDHLDKAVADLLGAQDVVRRDTGLAEVRHLAPDDPLGSQDHVDGVVQVDRTLAPELKGARGQVLGGGTGYDPTHL